MLRFIPRITAFLLTCFLAVSLAAQTQGIDILLRKARSLEARGRLDLAMQNWTKVLLVDPKQTDALAGLARYAKENGNLEEERSYLDRLRRINPKDPEISEIENMHVLTQEERNRLDEAGRLTMQHKPNEAMKIYKEVLGNKPPYGKWAEPYYEAEAASTGGREKAIVELRRLCAHDPGNEVYRLWLARVLIDDPATRGEGLQLLESIHDPGSVEQARAEWRQALLWEKENPAVLASMNAYLQRYPDQELEPIQKHLQEMQEHAAEETSKERGFAALRGQDLSTAEARFQQVLQRSPNDVNAMAGMGFVRFDQKRFEEAVSYFERASSLAPKRGDIRQGYEAAKFWLLMQQGSTALEHNDPEAALSAYQAALALHPQDEQAMLGIAEAEVHDRRLPEAEAEFEQVLNHSPNNTEAMAGLAFIRLDEKKFDDAAGLLEQVRRLAPNRADIEQKYKDAKYWSFMQHASQALDQNQPATAISEYQQALAIRPGASESLRGLAGAAERSGNYQQAIQAYDQLTALNPTDIESWLGMLRAEIGAKNPKQLIETAQRLPASVKPQIESRSDYLSELALAYYDTNQPDQGERTLRRAMDAATSADTTEALNARLDAANALMNHGKSNLAMEIYQQTTRLHPDNLLAWEALVGAYAGQRNFAQAKNVVRSMPHEVYQAASRNAGFLNSVAAIYSADGNCDEAEDFLNRSLNIDHAAGRQPSEGTLLQLANLWLREQNYAKAQGTFHQILGKQPNSVDAWHGYIIALHNQHQDSNVLAETQRMPTAVRAQLEKDASFLTLLAGSSSAAGHPRETVELLQRARSLYEAQNQTPPTEFDIQLGWAMFNDPGSDPRPFLQKVRARTDLNEKQRATINEIWANWSIRAAEGALEKKNAEQAIMILNDAQRDLPNNPRITGAIATVYARQHHYQKALSVYQAWNMAGARAADYRAAAGAALAAHKDELLDFYLTQGLARFPNDPDLLEMKGRQDVAHGNYKEGQNDLKAALRAATNPATKQQDLMEQSSSDSGALKRDTDESATAGRAWIPATPQAPACRETTSYLMPEELHIRFVSASSLEQDTTSQSGGSQSTVDQSGPDQNGSQAKQNISGSGSQNPAPQSPPGAVPSNANPGQAPANSPNQGVQETTNPDNVANSQANPERQQEIQDEIDVVEDRNTAFATIGSTAGGRTGDAGIDRLIIEDGIIGGSVVEGNSVRLSTEAHGLYLYSGTPNGQSKHLFGTLPAGATFGGQSTGGMTGELQLSTSTFGLDFSATPNTFPIQNLIGGVRFRPLNGPLTFTAVRDDVKDSLLSYAGVRDPRSGMVWGGVVANTGILQAEHRGTRVGQYASASFSYLTGIHVPTNWVGSGNAGLYFIVVKGLSVGASVTGMHYDKNLSFFSLGQGGYFSPQQYGLAAVPISWFSRHKRFEYEIRASLGAQYIEQERSPFFPTHLPFTLPAQGFYASTHDLGPNYNFLLRLGYRLTDHLYFDTFASANNARNYANQAVGFSIKILAHPLPTNTDLHVNSVPDWRGNQPFGITQ